MSDQLRLKLFIEVEGKVLLRIINQGSLLQELKSELSPDDGSIISLTYFYADSNVNLDTERDLEALMNLATIDNVTQFKAAAHFEHNVEDSSVKKKRPRIPESPAAMVAAEHLRLEKAKLVKEGLYPVPLLNGDTQFFEFCAEYNTMLGLAPSASPVRIFMREENREIARQLDEFMASDDLLFYLQGPPGVGKTKESIIWMLQHLVKGCEAGDLWAWIPLMKGGGNIYDVYLLDRSDSKNVRYRVFRTTDLVTALPEWGVKVVIFDNGNQSNRGPIDACVYMQLKTVTVSSLQMKFDNNYSRQQSFTVNGWKETEYLEACSDDDFYNLVKGTLQTGDFSEGELEDRALREEVVAAKYHLAGGSARWMFQYTADQLLSPAGAIHSIENHVDRGLYEDIINGFTGDRGITQVNHLLSRIDRRVVIVSQYVANLLVLRFGEKLLKQALLLLRHHPAMDGVLMEMDFMLRLGRSTPVQKLSIDLVMKPGADPVPALRSGSQKLEFRLSTFDAAMMTVADEDWFIPQIFNNGGFDCVQYRDKKLIFVQVARSSTHSFKLKWYEKFRAAFVKKFPELEITTCEVWFVVQENLVGAFKPAAASDTLTGYKQGTFKVAGMKRITA